MSLTMILALGAIGAVLLLAVLVRSMFIWTRIVEVVDKLPEADKTALGWPLEPGSAVQNRQLRNRVMWHGAPPGVDDAARAPVTQYRRLLWGSFALIWVGLTTVFGWVILWLIVPAALTVLVVRPWPKSRRVAPQ